jgi:hypothetical protein
MLWLTMTCVLLFALIVWAICRAAGNGERKAEASAPPLPSLLVVGRPEPTRRLVWVNGYRLLTACLDQSASGARRDIRRLTKADAVATLPGWRRDRRSRLIVAAADAMGLPIVDATTFRPLPAEQRRFELRDPDGACECDIEGVFCRVGELLGATAEDFMRGMSAPLNRS